MWIKTDAGNLLNLRLSHYIYIYQYSENCFVIKAQFLCSVGTDGDIETVSLKTTETIREANEYLEYLKDIIQK